MPCRSFARAYRLARPGQVVLMRGGTYPAQTVEAAGRPRGGRPVVFRPASGARVVVDGALVVEASNVEFRRLAATVLESVGASRQTFRGLDVDLLFIKGSRRVSVIGGDVGPTENDDSQVTSHEGRVPANILFDRVRFHDAVRTDPDAHTECLQIGAGVGVTIRRSRFERCAVHDVFIASWGRANGNRHPLRNFTIEKNVFGKTLEGHYSLRLAYKDDVPCRNFVIRDNVAAQNMYSDCEARGVRFLRNRQPSMSRHACEGSAGAVWDWNVYARGEPCGPNDVVRGAG